MHGNFSVYKADFSTAGLELMHVIVFHKEMHKYLISAERTNMWVCALRKLLNVCDALCVGAESITMTVTTKMTRCCQGTTGIFICSI